MRATRQRSSPRAAPACLDDAVTIRHRGDRALEPGNALCSPLQLAVATGAVVRAG